MEENAMRSAALVAAVLAACASTADPTATGRVSVATEQVGDLSVELLTDTQLRTGLTPIWLRIARAGQPVTDATVAFQPWMTMADGTGHGAPVLAPPALDAEGLYRCDVVFQMPTGPGETWTATVTVARPSAAPVDVPFDLAVAESGRAKTFLYTDPVTQAATKYVASFDLDAAAAVGLNPVTVTLHRRQDPSTFPPVNDATIHMTSLMPSMGHGGGACVDPVLVTEGAWASVGVYAGKVAFSMPGDWQTTLAISSGGVPIGAPAFVTDF
jgi:hypothetical protein